jgi:DNA replication and repair protein RecF
MKLSSVQIQNFRNLEKTLLHLNPSLNIFLGDNGQGKTNFLESVYCLTKGESFRPGTVENLVPNLNSKDDTLQNPLVVNAFLEKRELKNQVTLTIQENAKKVLVNNKKVTSSFLQKSFPSVLFSPESLASIKEGPESRRLLLDELILSLSPASSKILSEYKKALRTRNRLLKNFSTGLSTEAQSIPLLNSVNPIFLKCATEVTWLRIQAVKKIKAEFNQAMKFISGRENVDLAVDYLISGQSALEKSKEDMYYTMRNRLVELSRAELTSGSSLVGPQKHDVEFLYDGNNSRFYCSQGQQRAIILSFKIAQVAAHFQTNGCYPILLLDDVMSELDREKNENLVRFLTTTRAQVLLTSTDFALPDSLASHQYSVFRIHEGRISQA